ncbi:MAG: alpha-galactosidase [Clostridia bacterium]|nr:alpha-galactosidase [Clostridia bacterium]
MIDVLYEVDGQLRHISGATSNDDLGITADKSQGVKVVVEAYKPLRIISATFKRGWDYDADCKIMVNGYQSWTDTREYSIDEKMPDIGKFYRYFFGKPFRASGDYAIAHYNGRKGFFHGVSYSYIRQKDRYTLFGSLNERTGYTFMYFDVKQSLITFVKDVEGVTIEGEYVLFNVKRYTGECNEVFDAWFKDMEVPAPRAKHACGYTSWYNYYTNISEEIINRDIDSFISSDVKIDIFQIDDGYQTCVGDWLSLKPTFNGGMRRIVDKLHGAGIKAGLWLAPFSAHKRSELALNHPDWLLRDTKGKPVSGGYNWGGFYALDIYNPDVRDYLKKVFDTVLNEWGFDMVKLDFLYNCCQIPAHNKSRGEIMCDGMDLIRELVGDKEVLGCGVPMWPAFGKVDYCRIGADMNLRWNETRAEKKMHRERVSTPNNVNNSIFRRQLDGRAFVNDPDVILIRDHNIRMSDEQRKLIARINKMFGNLIFVSDDVSRYSKEQWQTYKYATDGMPVTIKQAYYLGKKDIYVSYVEDGKDKELIFDVTSGVIMRDK